MRSHVSARGRLGSALILVGFAFSLPLSGSARAAAPVITIGASGAKIQIASASLAEAIDALSRAAGFRVTYDGARPNAMLFNAEIDTPSVSMTLFKLLDGQNLNYAVLFDRTGKKVTTLMVMGAAPRTPGSAAGGASRPQAFTPPRNPRAEAPPVDDDPAEAAVPEGTPEPSPPVAPSPQRGPGAPFPPSPFGPRPPFGSPAGPRPTPSPSP